MKRLTIVVATSEPSARDQIGQILAARNYKVVATTLGAPLLALCESEPHDVAIIAPVGSDSALAAYRSYREALGQRATKVIVAGDVEAAKPIADRFKDRFLPGPIERDPLLHAIELASRHLITIVVADDEPLIRKMFSMFLTGQGFKVVTADDGDDALDKVTEVVPDLVITDIKMPHRDGYELCRAIKEQKRTQHIPVIIVSALGGELDVDRGFNSGASEYVTKPVDLNDLLQRIQAIFRGIAMRGREKVLIAIRSQIERSGLHPGLEQQGFEVIATQDAEEALEGARKARPGIVVVDYDIAVGTPAGAPSPGETGAIAAADGRGLRERLREERALRDVPVVVLLGRNQKVDFRKREELDAAALVAKPYSAERLVAQIERILGERRLRLEADQQMLLQAITALVTALEARDKYTRGHSENVAKYSKMIARYKYDSEEEIARLHLSARLHDIGKIGVADAVLLKPGRLTDEEMAIIKTHPMKGVEILSPIPSLQDIIPGVRWHHERLDGKGYPDGLKAPDIPLQARIIAVADTFDALTSHRPYRRGMALEKAVEILKSAAGTQLEPELVEIFIREIRDTKLVIAEPTEPGGAKPPAAAPVPIAPVSTPAPAPPAPTPAPATPHPATAGAAAPKPVA